MVIKVSSKHQVTIPNGIARAFHLKKGDIIDVEIVKNRIVMTPKEVIYRDKYPKKDLLRAQKVLSKKNPKEETEYKSGAAMIKALKRMAKK